MSSLLGIGTSALTAFRQSLTTIGQNIANVNTPGYNRQSVVLGTREPQFIGVGYSGNGVQIQSIERAYNEFLDEQSRTAGSGSSRFSTLASFAGRIDGILADPNSGLSSALSSFYSAIQNFANEPSSPAARGALLAETDSLVQRFKSLDDTLAEFAKETSSAVAETVTEINQLAESIANLNRQIVAAGGKSPPNDLLDQRSQLIRDLAERVNVTVVNENNGSASVFIGSGQTLVIGSERYPLGTVRNEFDPTRNEVVYQGQAGQTLVSDVLNGGTIGALFEFENNVLDPTRRALGSSAQAVAQIVNEQNAAGLDGNDNLGGAIFGIGAPVATASSNNSGTGAAVVTIDDLSAVANAEYRLINDGSNYRLFRADTGAEIALAGSGTGADPFLAEGLSIVVSGAPAAGDQISIEPTRFAVAGLTRAAVDGRDFAAAAPLRGITGTGNLSSATIDNGIVTDASNPALLATSVITFTGANTYSINGSGSFAYTPGSPISVNGAEFQISGTPVSGDQFTIEKNTGATSDNRNALALAETRTQPILQGGSLSVGQSYAQLVADVGSATRQANASAEAQAVLLQSANTRRLQDSGVDLDEEAANLIKFQQSYQAAAQVISVASELFDTLLAATRR